MKEQIYFNNYDGYDYETIKETLIEDGYDEPSEEQVYSRMSDWEYYDWMDMIHELKDKICSSVLVTGTCGTWRGNFAGGKVFSESDLYKNEDSLLEHILNKAGKDCNYFKIGLNEQGNMFIQCSHHDGTNYYEVKNLTDKGWQAYDDWNYGIRFKNVTEQEMHEKLYNSNYYSRKIKL